MTDRELLELAAKAAGNIWTIKNANTGETYYGVGVSEGHFHGSAPRWNPLTDDGDALRLAVRLGIDLEWCADGRVAAYRHANADGYCFTAFESSRENREENTRRAIVRAAAEIGRGEP